LRRFLTALGVASAVLVMGAIGGALAADTVSQEHDAAVALARSGKNAEALAILERLARDDPGDLGIARDRVVISVWAGRDGDAARLYAALPHEGEPAYVIAAGARAERNLHRYDKALALYRAGHRRFPGDSALAAGEIETLADSGDARGALALARKLLKAEGEAEETLLAAAYAATAAHAPKDALRYANRVLARDPRNREAERQRRAALEAMGAPRNVEQRTHADAVALARGGKTAAALALLEQLARENPGDVGVARDRVVVSLWAGRDADAARLYAALPHEGEPAAVIAAGARAERNLHHYDKALALYRMARQRFPRDAALAAGEIETMADAGDAKGALALAATIVTAEGEAEETLLAAAYAATAADLPVDALRYADRALARSPKSREAKRRRLFALAAMGAPREAEKLAEAEPDLVSPAELRRLQGDAAAQLARWDSVNPAPERERYAAADSAIAALDALIARWSKEPGAEDVLWRARFDRIVALQDRNRMAEVVAEYEAARRAGVAVPSYVLSDVASAFLALRQPEAARDLYRRALAADPGNIDIELGLFHALIESEEYDEAFRQVDASVASRKPFVPLKGAEPVANGDRVAADIAAANARYYADDPPEAERRFRGMSAMAPNDATLLTGLARIEAGRGWPRMADLTLERARAQQPDDAAIDIQQTRDHLALQEWRPFEQGVADLARRLPENTDVERLVVEEQIHNRAELRVFADRAWRSATNINGGDGLDFGAELYSPPVGQDWRVFSGWRLAHERLPEGNITERLYDGGVEYRVRDLTAEGALHFAEYGKNALGGRINADWSRDDYWQLGGGAEIFSADTPIRALKHDITANSLSAHAVFRESEARAVKVAAEELLFSDGNDRTVLGGEWRERIFTRPHLRLDTLVDTGASHNTKQNEPFFNPDYDAIATGGAELVHTLYRRYELAYEEAWIVSAGPYWQDHFGTGLAWGARYEQRLKSDDVDAALGLGFARQPYDGVYENTVTLSFTLTWRF
jgi:biofilm PGA synthesis protein PgaA